MAKSLRSTLKSAFDKVVYRYAFINRVVRTLNKGLSPFLKFRIRPFGVFTVKFKSGLTFKLVTNETSTVTKRLFWEGPDKYEYTPIFETLVKKCNAFADIGANLGFYSILAAKANPSIKVYAFEPARAPHHFLKENVNLNNAGSQIVIERLALSDRRGTIAFHELGTKNGKMDPTNLGGTGKIITTSSAEFEEVLVPSDTMDHYFNDQTPAPDLIKIDTEGTENLILNGGSSILKAKKPIIICETLFNVIEKELEEIMRTHGYEFFNFQNNQLNKVQTIVRHKDNGVRDCFFVHPEKYPLVKEFIGN